MKTRIIGACIVAILIVARDPYAASDLSPARNAADGWPQWCGRPDRNMVSAATGLVDRFDEIGATGSLLDIPPNIKWFATLGEVTYGSPVVTGGKVYVGGCARDPGSQTALGALWCFNAADGKFLWKFRSQYIRGMYNRSFGITSTPTVEGDRVYLLGHVGEVLCLDAHGLADGNAGPFQEEEALLATERIMESQIAPNGDRIVKYSPGKPGKLEATDADIIWRFDMIEGVRCWPYNALNAAIIVRGDYLYVPTCSVKCGRFNHTTARIIDEWKKATGQKKYESPSLIVLDKKTGKLLATDNAGFFEQTFHGCHSSPSMGTVNGRELIFLGGGNGVCYAFDPNFTAGGAGKPGVLKMVWQFNCADPSTYDKASSSTRVKDPVEIVATPVFFQNRVYVAVGNDLERSGPRAPQGRLVCIDATQTGDITRSGKVWSYDTLRSSSSTVAIHDGLLYTGDVGGNVCCLDANTGRPYWNYKTAPVWGSPLVADGKVFVPTDGKGLLVFAEGKELKKLSGENGKFELENSLAVAGSTIYLAGPTHLYALEK